MLTLVSMFSLDSLLNIDTKWSTYIFNVSLLWRHNDTFSYKKKWKFWFHFGWTVFPKPIYFGRFFYFGRIWMIEWQIVPKYKGWMVYLFTCNFVRAYSVLLYKVMVEFRLPSPLSTFTNYLIPWTGRFERPHFSLRWPRRMLRQLLKINSSKEKSVLESYFIR